MKKITNFNISLVDAKNKGGMPYFRLKIVAQTEDKIIYSDEFPIFKDDTSLEKILSKIEQFKQWFDNQSDEDRRLSKMIKDRYV